MPTATAASMRFSQRVNYCEKRARKSEMLSPGVVLDDAAAVDEEIVVTGYP